MSGRRKSVAEVVDLGLARKRLNLPVAAKWRQRGQRPRLQGRPRPRPKHEMQCGMTDDASKPFWKRKTLEEMSETEWESLCDGCARCCLVKLEDEDSGKIHYTDLGCTLLDTKTCRCRDYPNRQAKVPDCVRLTPANARSLSWLPISCAYRLIAAGMDLPAWHPLVSGRRESVIEAGISVQDKVFASEDDIPPEQWQNRLARWPDRWPRGVSGRPKRQPKR